MLQFTLTQMEQETMVFPTFNMQMLESGTKREIGRALSYTEIT